MQETDFNNGEPIGIFTMWFENGRMKSKGTYNEGELVSQEFWDENGNKKD